MYFTPAFDSCWLNGRYTKVGTRLPNEAFVVGLRFGFLYEGGTVSLFVLSPARDYQPELYGTVAVEFDTAPYFALNLYGRIKAVRFVPL